MNLAGSPTELTTSVTDALLAVECVLVCVRLWMLQPPFDTSPQNI